MSCQPSYAYRPDFTPSATDCVAPVYARRRSRVSIEGSESVTPLFFRSKAQAFDANALEVELVGAPTNLFRVYSRGVVVSTYPVTFQAGAISTLRAMITSDLDSLIEMPEVGIDIFDLRTTEEDGAGGAALTPGLAPFVRIALTGGEGAPEDATVIATIRTGPQRTIYVISSEEDIDGTEVVPPASRRIQQWNGFSWISYCNNVPGQCPGEGTC